MSARRVLFLHQNAVLGGAELYLLDVVRAFDGQACVVLFDHGPFEAKLREAGVDVRVRPSAWAGRGVRGGSPRFHVGDSLDAIGLVLHVARLARGRDLIFANSPKALLIAALASRLARRPVIWALHDLLTPDHFSDPAISQTVAFANSAAVRVLANSEATAAAFLAHGGRAEAVRVIYCGFPLPVRAADTGAARQALGRKDGPLAAVFGRVTPWKGQHVAVELLGNIPELALLVVGTGDPDYGRALADRAAELNVIDRVAFLGHRDDVDTLMSGVDVVLHTSVAAEPFGRVIVEAMLCGKPVVVAAAGGAAELVEDGVTGLLAPPGDVDGFARAVRRLIDDPAFAAGVGRAARAEAERRFSLARMMGEIDREIEGVLAR